MDKLISVIVPVYNVESYLPQCIESIINQTYKNLEIILVDDGSTDNSGKICDEYAEKDSRILVIHKTNGGLSDARNNGINNAKGEYVGFVDSDDWIEKCMYEYLIKTALLYDADIVNCGFYYEYKNIRREFKSKSLQIYKDKNIVTDCYKNTYFPHAVWCKIYKKEIWEKIKFPKGYLYEDAYIYFKTLELSKCCVLYPMCFYHYRQRRNSIMYTSFNVKQLQLLDIQEKNQEHVKIFYPKLQSIARKKCLMANKYIIQNIILSAYSEEYKQLLNDLKNNIKKELYFILRSNLFSLKAKFQFLFIIMNESFYKYILLLYKRKQKEEFFD